MCALSYMPKIHFLCILHNVRYGYLAPICTETSLFSRYPHCVHKTEIFLADVCTDFKIFICFCTRFVTFSSKTFKSYCQRRLSVIYHPKHKKPINVNVFMFILHIKTSYNCTSYIFFHKIGSCLSAKWDIFLLRKLQNGNNCDNCVVKVHNLCGENLCKVTYFITSRQKIRGNT